MLIKFKHASDRKYIHSLEADHCDWLRLYNFRVIDECTIYIDDKFMGLIDYDKAISFGMRGLKKVDCDQNKVLFFSRISNHDTVSFLDDIKLVFS